MSGWSADPARTTADRGTMKPLPLIIAIAPLVVFSLMAKWLAERRHRDCAVVAAAIAAIALLAIRPHWPPKILPVTPCNVRGYRDHRLRQ
jgi:hypothetical protein